MEFDYFMAKTFVHLHFFGFDVLILEIRIKHN